jgi:hypothetical protein
MDRPSVLPSALSLAHLLECPLEMPPVLDWATDRPSVLLLAHPLERPLEMPPVLDWATDLRYRPG